MKNIEDIKVLVVGDIMIDQYIVGEVNRISPEAPVQIVNVTNEYITLGGCGNVVSNLRSIGAQVDCYSSIGSDKYGDEIFKKLKELDVGNYLQHWSWETTVKERIVAGDKQTQLLRVDRETIYPIIFYPECVPPEKEYDIVIISDYAKGFVSKEMVDYLKHTYPNSKIIVDPKPKNFYMYSSGIYMITPNEKEYKEINNIKSYLTKDIEFILETKGKEGMVLHDKNKSWKMPSQPVEIYNVSGAGDTVISAVSVCLALDFYPLKACEVANLCASYVITQPGTTPIPPRKFRDYIQNYLG